MYITFFFFFAIFLNKNAPGYCKLVIVVQFSNNARPLQIETFGFCLNAEISSSRLLLDLFRIPIFVSILNI